MSEVRLLVAAAAALAVVWAVRQARRNGPEHYTCPRALRERNGWEERANFAAARNVWLPRHASSPPHYGRRLSELDEETCGNARWPNKNKMPESVMNLYGLSPRFPLK